MPLDSLLEKNVSFNVSQINFLILIPSCFKYHKSRKFETIIGLYTERSHGLVLKALRKRYLLSEIFALISVFSAWPTKYLKYSCLYKFFWVLFLIIYLQVERAAAENTSARQDLLFFFLSRMVVTVRSVLQIRTIIGDE